MSKILKPRILLYEGIPGSGKTTLRYAYGKATNFEDLTIDRFSPTQAVFSQLRGETPKLVGEIEEELDKNFEIIVVLCVCSPELAFQRCLQKNDDLDSDLSTLRRLSFLYDSYFKRHCKFSKIIEIDTSGSVEDSLVSMKEKLRNLNEK